ncbi:MAG: VCBS repeat-containing protein [DPANN group archaeon]|nr:VCBS repeat-containing protein [DPANN group archaeon]
MSFEFNKLKKNNLHVLLLFFLLILILIILIKPYGIYTGNLLASTSTESFRLSPESINLCSIENNIANLSFGPLNQTSIICKNDSYSFSQSSPSSSLPSSSSLSGLSSYLELTFSEISSDNFNITGTDLIFDWYSEVVYDAQIFYQADNGTYEKVCTLKIPNTQSQSICDLSDNIQSISNLHNATVRIYFQEIPITTTISNLITGKVLGVMNNNESQTQTLDNSSNDNISVDNTTIGDEISGDIDTSKSIENNTLNLTDNSTITNITESVNITTDNITADNITIENLTNTTLSLDNITTDNLTTENITNSTIIFDNITTDNVTINNITIDNLTTDNITYTNKTITDNLTDTNTNLSSNHPILDNYTLNISLPSPADNTTTNNTLTDNSSTQNATIHISNIFLNIKYIIYNAITLNMYSDITEYFPNDNVSIYISGDSKIIDKIQLTIDQNDYELKNISENKWKFIWTAPQNSSTKDVKVTVTAYDLKGKRLDAVTLKLSPKNMIATSIPETKKETAVNSTDIKFGARLIYENNSAYKGAQLFFGCNQTDGSYTYLGTNITDDSGWAVLTSDNSSVPEDCFLYVDYRGNTTLHTLPSFNSSLGLPVAIPYKLKDLPTDINIYDSITGELIPYNQYASLKSPKKINLRLADSTGFIFFDSVDLDYINTSKRPSIIKDSKLKQKIEKKTKETVNDLIWVEADDFVPNTTGGKIILPSIGYKTFKCDGTLEDPDCFEIDTCSVSEKPCYEYDNGTTIIYVNHFSGAFNTINWTTDDDWNTGTHVNTTSSAGDLILSGTNTTGYYLSNTTDTTYTIIRIKPIWNSTEQDANKNITVEISADNGTTWLTTTNNTNYTTGAGISTGHELVYRINLSTNDSATSPKVHDITLDYYVIIPNISISLDTDKTTATPNEKITVTGYAVLQPGDTDVVNNIMYLWFDETLISPSEWWNTSWRYRVPITVDTGNYGPIINENIFKRINFRQMLDNQGISEDVDNNSIRVISDTGKEVESNVIFWYTGNEGLVWFYINTTIPTNTEKIYYVYFETTSNPKTPKIYARSPPPDVAVQFQGGSDNGGSGGITRIMGDYNGSFTIYNNDIPNPGANSHDSQCIADFDNDGDWDYVMSKNTDSNIYYYRNNGNGDGFSNFTSMGSIGTRSSTSHFMACATADFNKDGNMDFISFSDTNCCRDLFLGNGDGTFNKTENALANGVYNRDISVGDFDGDGNMDIAIGHYGAYNWYIYYGFGDGNFTAPIYIGNYGGSNADPYAVASGDWNHDGVLDIIVGGAYYGHDGTARKKFQGKTGGQGPSYFTDMGYWTGPNGIDIGDGSRSNVHGWMEGYDWNHDGNDDIIGNIYADNIASQCGIYYWQGTSADWGFENAVKLGVGARCWMGEGGTSPQVGHNLGYYVISPNDLEQILITNNTGFYNYTFIATSVTGTHTLKINTTDENEVYGENSTNITQPSIIISDQQAISIESQTKYILIDEQINISVKVYKNIDNPIDSVWVNITMPNSTVKTYFLDNTTNRTETQIWDVILDTTSEFDNLIGTYNITFYANSTLENGSTIIQQVPTQLINFYIQKLVVFVKNKDGSSVSDANIIVYVHNTTDIVCQGNTTTNGQFDCSAVETSKAYDILYDNIPGRFSQLWKRMVFIPNNTIEFVTPYTYSCSDGSGSNCDVYSDLEVRVYEDLINLKTPGGNLLAIIHTTTSGLSNDTSATNGATITFDKNITSVWDNPVCTDGYYYGWGKEYDYGAEGFIFLFNSQDNIVGCNQKIKITNATGSFESYLLVNIYETTTGFLSCSGHTNSEGTINCGLSSGLYDLKTENGSYALNVSKNSTVTLIAYDSPKTLSDLTIKLTNSTGDALPYIPLNIYENDTGNIVCSVTSNEDGYIICSLDSAKTYDVLNYTNISLPDSYIIDITQYLFEIQTLEYGIPIKDNHIIVKDGSTTKCDGYTDINGMYLCSIQSNNYDIYVGTDNELVENVKFTLSSSESHILEMSPYLLKTEVIATGGGINFSEINVFDHESSNLVCQASDFQGINYTVRCYLANRSIAYDVLYNNTIGTIDHMWKKTVLLPENLTFHESEDYPDYCNLELRIYDKYYTDTMPDGLLLGTVLHGIGKCSDMDIYGFDSTVTSEWNNPVCTGNNFYVWTYSGIGKRSAHYNFSGSVSGCNLDITVKNTYNETLTFASVSVYDKDTQILRCVGNTNSNGLLSCGLPVGNYSIRACFAGYCAYQDISSLGSYSVTIPNIMNTISVVVTDILNEDPLVSDANIIVYVHNTTDIVCQGNTNTNGLYNGQFDCSAVETSKAYDILYDNIPGRFSQLWKRMVFIHNTIEFVTPYTYSCSDGSGSNCDVYSDLEVRVYEDLINLKTPGGNLLAIIHTTTSGLSNDTSATNGATITFDKNITSVWDNPVCTDGYYYGWGKEYDYGAEGFGYMFNSTNDISGCNQSITIINESGSLLNNINVKIYNFITGKLNCEGKTNTNGIIKCGFYSGNYNITTEYGAYILDATISNDYIIQKYNSSTIMETLDVELKDIIGDSISYDKLTFYDAETSIIACQGYPNEQSRLICSLNASKNYTVMVWEGNVSYTLSTHKNIELPDTTSIQENVDLTVLKYTSDKNYIPLSEEIIKLYSGGIYVAQGMSNEQGHIGFALDIAPTYYLNIFDYIGTDAIIAVPLTTTTYVYVSLSPKLNKTDVMSGETILLNGTTIFQPTGDLLPNLNVSVYLNGTLLGNTTTNASGEYAYQITAPTTDGNFTLMVNTTDLNGIYGEYLTNFIVDTSPPNITIISPKNRSYTSSVWFNLSVTDIRGTDWCGYSLDNTANITLSNDTLTNFYDVNSSMTEETHTVIFYCNDTAGKLNYTTEYFNIDLTLPTITLDAPVNNTVITEPPLWINLTMADDLLLDTSWWSNNSGTINYTLNSPWDIDMSEWPEGDNIIHVWVNDSAGNTVQKVYLFILNRYHPEIEFVDPTDNNSGLVNRDWSYINVSASNLGSEDNITVFLDWNNSLVGWWRFNNESGENETYFKDWSSYGNNGSCITTTCPNYTTGYLGKALQFDGSDDYVNAGNDASLNLTNEITIMAWVKPTGTIGSGGYAIISENGNHYTQIRRDNGSGSKIAFWHASAGIWFESNTDVPMNQWSFIVVTFNKYDINQNVKFYLNGVANGTGDTTTALVPTANNIWFGNVYTTSRYFNGTIDEVKIFNRALTPAEINSSYDAGLYRLEKNITNLVDGTYTYTAHVQDLVGDLNQTETRTLTVDTISPIVTLISPEQDDYISSILINFVFKIIDNLNTSMVCSLYINNILITTNSSTNNDTETTFSNITVSENINQNWTVKCSDGVNKNELSIRTFSTDTTSPSIEFISPTKDNNSYISENYTYINWTLTEINPDTILLNWAGTNETMSQNYLNKTGLTDGIYTYYVWVNDTSGTSNQTETRTLTVDTLPPIVTLVSPEQDDYLSSTSMDFIFNVTDNLETYMVCSLYINGTLIKTKSSTNNDSATTFSSITVSENINQNWTVNCSDGVNTAQPSIRTFNIDTTPPYIEFISPTEDNNSYISKNYTYINWSLSEINSDTIFLNWAGINETMSQNYLNKTGLTESIYTYYVWANDTAGNSNQTETRTLTIDTTAPTVTLVSPIDNIYSSATTMDFIFNVTDNLETYMVCSLYINDTLITTNSSTYNATDTTFSSIAVSENINQNWTVNCSDGVNTAQPSIRTFNIDTTPPSISIQSPTPTIYGTLNIDLNYSAQDTNGILSCLYELNGANTTLTSCQNTTITAVEGNNNLKLYAKDTFNNWNMAEVDFTVNLISLQITKYLSPDVLIAGENETITVNTTLKINQTKNDVYSIKITDEVPYDFYNSTVITVYFKNATTAELTELTTNIIINIVDLAQNNNTQIQVNITNISETNLAGYIKENDSIILTYEMTSSQLDSGDTRTMYINVTATDINENQKDAYTTKNISASGAVLRGSKSIYINPANPQDITVTIVVDVIGDAGMSEILLSDFLPLGATINNKTVTYYNNSNSQTYSLYNDSDYFVGNPAQDTLPDGVQVDIYHYNFTYNYTNWSGTLYDNDSITIIYNAKLLGGGSWLLPTILGGYDPAYKTHIITEMYTDVNIPLFDIILKVLTKTVSLGNPVTALLTMENVGGPKAKVDVMINYAIKTQEGQHITGSTDTIAITDKKETILNLELPKGVKEGVYTFEALVTYTGREAISTRDFEVIDYYRPENNDNLITIGLSIIIILLIIIFIWNQTYTVKKRNINLKNNNMKHFYERQS